MKGKKIGRKWPVLFLLCGFFMGISVGKWLVPQTVFAEENAWERQEKQEKLPVVIYNDKGQKVCMREDAVLSLSEELKVEIPVYDWQEGQEALVEIRVIGSDGNTLMNHIRIKRILLHNAEK